MACQLLSACCTSNERQTILHIHVCSYNIDIWRVGEHHWLGWWELHNSCYSIFCCTVRISVQQNKLSVWVLACVGGCANAVPHLPKIAHPSLPCLGRSQASTQQSAEAWVSTWRNQPTWSQYPLCQVSYFHWLAIAFYTPMPNLTLVGFVPVVCQQMIVINNMTIFILLHWRAHLYASAT